MSQAYKSKHQARIEPPTDKANYLASSEKTKQLMIRAERFALLNKPILITGPSGSGKSHLAEHIHLLSAKADGPCVKRGCGEIDNATIASTLFGHRRGAFTDAFSDQQGLLELADGGTLILDDIDYLPLKYQSHIFRFLDDGKHSRLGNVADTQKSAVRLIVTSNKNLEHLAKEKLFLPDLYFRLRYLELKTCALSERPRDIATLAILFLKRLCQDIYGNENALSFDQEALELDPIRKGVGVGVADFLSG